MANIIFNKDARPTKTIELPTLKGSELIIYTTLKVKEQRALSKKYPNASDPTSEDAQNLWFEMCVKWIKEWNLTDEDWKVLEISLGILDEFTTEDIKLIISTITWKDLSADNSVKN